MFESNDAKNYVLILELSSTFFLLFRLPTLAQIVPQFVQKGNGLA